LLDRMGWSPCTPPTQQHRAARVVRPKPGLPPSGFRGSRRGARHRCHGRVAQLLEHAGHRSAERIRDPEVRPSCGPGLTSRRAPEYCLPPALRCPGAPPGVTRRG